MFNRTILSSLYVFIYLFNRIEILAPIQMFYLQRQHFLFRIDSIFDGSSSSALKNIHSQHGSRKHLVLPA